MNTFKPFATTLDPQSSRANHTGSWRTSEPIYQDRTAPCHGACPIGQNVREWLALAQQGQDESAWRVIMDKTPFPATLGRVCYHPCESMCNRDSLDGSVRVHSVERYLGDKALELGWRMPSSAAATHKHVLVIGAGPAGLSCAYQLARRGHRVTVVDQYPQAGGMMRYGIPEYRLPRSVLDAEVQHIVDCGVELLLNTRIEDLATRLAGEEFDAAFVASGAHRGQIADIPIKEQSSVRVIGAVEYLRAVASGNDIPTLGKRVAVYGGGNTAIDAARTARRLGAEQVTVVYRRDRQRMPAHRSEYDDAVGEGVKFAFLRTIAATTGQGLSLEITTLTPDNKAVGTGQFETLDTDALIVALGQLPETQFLAALPGVKRSGEGAVEIDSAFRTGQPGVFAGGDVINAQRTMTAAVGHGRLAAASIHAYLTGQPMPENTHSHDHVMTIGDLNTHYFTIAVPSEQSRRPVQECVTNFDETVAGLSESQARYEAQRCLSCGTCIRCSTCFSVCPDSAIRRKPDGTYEVDSQYCKGCGICAQECPSGAIQMK